MKSPLFKVADKIKILGIYFENDKMAKEIANNWNSKLERQQSIMKDWSKRDLSTQGKVIVVKTFIVSQLVYVTQSTGLPRLALQTINSLLYKFLRQKRLSNRRAFEKVKRKAREVEYSKRGLNMINVTEFQNHLYLQQ